jgi:hypothetical protein
MNKLIPVGILIFILVGYFLYQRKDSETKPEKKEEKTTTTTPVVTPPPTPVVTPPTTPVVTVINPPPTTEQKQQVIMIDTTGLPSSYTANNDVIITRFASPNGQHIAIAENDGNLVIKKKDGTTVWDSKTASGSENKAYYGFSNCPQTENCVYTLKFQPDCNLVTYSDKPKNSFGNNVVWNIAGYKNSTWNGQNSSKPCTLKLEDNGKMVVTNGAGNQVWIS